MVKVEQNRYKQINKMQKIYRFHNTYFHYLIEESKNKSYSGINDYFLTIKSLYTYQ